MKFTLNWLKDHLETDASLDEILEGLVGCGFEVESVTDFRQTLKPFKVAYVREAVQHPNAERLRVCSVETEEGVLQVVCGAPNARTGLRGIFAPIGTHVPGTGLDLVKANIRGVESNGMLCSERELLISEEHDGIIDLAEDFPVGTPAATALGLDDPIIDIAVTPNRPDALGVYGVARDLAAKGLGKLKPLSVPVVKGTFASPIAVSTEDPEGCPLFIGRTIRGVKNGPSPLWLQRRLRAIGLRPISALVDITNYITHGYGRPLHVFDAGKVKGNITARSARDGEEILALDGRTYRLEPGMVVIADDAGPEGIGGIMGGEHSGCTDETTSVFLEAAYFDAIRTAKTGRKLGIQSDARYRFERGVDPCFVETGAELGTAMILDLCGGEASDLVIAGKIPAYERSYILRKDRVRTLGGVDVAPAEQKRILEALGFGVTETAEGFDCRVPSWRPDVHGEADLVEEICRIIGLDNIPAAPMDRPHPVARPVLTPLQRRAAVAERILAARGLNEAVTWSFVSKPQAELFGGGSYELELANPISSELSDMRPSILPTLIAAVGRNIARGFGDVGLFEVGPAYGGDEPQDETLRATGIRRGRKSPRHWSGQPEAVDVFDAKADALALLDAVGVSMDALQVVQGAPAWFHPGRSGTLQLGPKNQLGWFGELHPRVLEAMDVKGPLVGFEIVLNAIPDKRAKGTARPALAQSDLMPLTRDFAFVLDRDVPADKLLRAVKGADKQFITAVSLFDLFEGEAAERALGQGKKSIAVEVTLQPKAKTLTDEEIEAISARIVAQATKATGASLRS
ncbi:phenylalanine--tRNA ligase subunit beta [Rhodoligotrophos ferricapiens]|uniref:phenylalanine--tRNA ligase subunit beta n=1 Tax=Rhodoligotrophos ferricapiens TaxID=3069264 RepID=UPI00315D7A07